MIVGPVNARWWFKLNGFLRHAMVRGTPGFGLPKIVLTEYPRSGGTWVCQMLAEYLGIPNPRNQLPPRRRCIVHGHFLHIASPNDVIVMWRDGRDVMVSDYYYVLFERSTTLNRWVYMNRKRSGIEDPHDIQRHLPRFLEYCFANKVRHGMSWTSFTDAWKCRTGYVETSYEALNENPRRELTKLLQALSVPAAGRREIDDAKLDSCIAKFSFENVAGRKQGDEDVRSFTRKGIVGDWKGKFTHEARQVFDHYAGQTLIDLGYEADRSWVKGQAAVHNGN